LAHYDTDTFCLDCHGADDNVCGVPMTGEVETKFNGWGAPQL